MRTYVLRRVAQAVLVLWAAYTLSFALLSAQPGDAIDNRVNAPESGLSKADGEVLKHFYGVDKPVTEQYAHDLVRALHGQLGLSLDTAQPVQKMVWQVLPSTLELTLAGLVAGLLLAGLVALLINYGPWPWFRSLVSSLPALFAAVPTFVVGIVALQYLSFRLHLIPSVDDGSLRALIAPAVTVGLIIAAPLSQVLAQGIRSTRSQSFVHVQQAKGAGEGYIFRKNILRNSSLPVLTLLGLAFGELIAGSVITESVYAREGVGRLIVKAVTTQDLPVVQGVVILSTVAYVVINLAVDLAYPFLDPRVLIDGKTARTRRLSDKAVAVGPVEEQIREPAPPRLPAEVAMP